MLDLHINLDNYLIINQAVWSLSLYLCPLCNRKNLKWTETTRGIKGDLRVV